MSKKFSQYRLVEPNKYNGSIESKERLKYLYYIAKLNIRDYVNEGNAYVKYIANKLNEINKDKKLSNIQNYDEVFYRVFKITEIDNVANLTRLLFNVLTSFDAFLCYISSELKQISHNELTKVIKELEPILKIYVKDSNGSIDLTFFISEVRNTFIHNGKYIAQFSMLPNDSNEKYVPGISIQLNQIFKEEYFNENNIPEDSCLDTIEIFNIIYEKLVAIQDVIDLI